MRSLALLTLSFSTLFFGCAESHRADEDRDASITCSDIEEAYAEARRDAFRCDPAALEDPCTERVWVGLACGCEELASAEETDAIDAIGRAQEAFGEQGCLDTSIACGACLVPIRGECREEGGEGRCVSIYSEVVEP